MSKDKEYDFYLRIVAEAVKYSLYDIFRATPYVQNGKNKGKKIYSNWKNMKDSILFFKQSRLFALSGLNLSYLLNKYIKDYNINVESLAWADDVKDLLQHAKEIDEENERARKSYSTLQDN